MAGCAETPGGCGPATTPSVATPACPGTMWRDGPWQYTQTSAGCLSRTQVGATIPDGVYKNATITYVGGVITAVAPGANLVVTPADPCSVGTTMTVPGEGVTVSTDRCNMLRSSGGVYSVEMFVQGRGGLLVSGCGTRASPLILTMPAVAGGATGLTYSSAGITFVQGLATAFTPPVMSVVADAASDLTATTDPLTHVVTIGRTAASVNRAPPCVVCDNPTNSTNTFFIGEANTTYDIKTGAAGALVTSVTTNALGTAIITLSGGLYSTWIGTTRVGFIAHAGCV